MNWGGCSEGGSANWRVQKNSDQNGMKNLGTFGEVQRKWRIAVSKRESLPTAAWGQAKKQVLRGGSFNNNPNNIRATNRNNNEPDNANNNIGFRCAVASPGSFLKGQVP
ncbi:MAG: SUMF1/EgtB/PvdO family nonheme iron enzyme [Candidatus Lokiarchaeota archaeon]|nr:SUMF1/EgtB/PvdO family nonheme iron enzyme [Candidatus Lokiarchaeota archaeon]